MKDAPSPVEMQIDAIAAGLQQAEAAGDGALTIRQVIALLGEQSHSFVILVFCVLNMIPGPPGYGGTIACAIIAFAIAMIMGRPPGLPRFIGERRLSPRLASRMLQQLRWFSTLVARFSSPRLEFLAAEQGRMAVGCFVLMLSIPMVIPIPLINAVPNVGIAVICLSRINRDGAGMIAGGIIGLAGLTIAGLLIWGVVSLGLAAGDMVGTGG